MEACGTAHHWGRVAQDHEVTLVGHRRQHRRVAPRGHAVEHQLQHPIRQPLVGLQRRKHRNLDLARLAGTPPLLRSRGLATRNCRSFSATRPACTPCQYTSRRYRGACAFDPATSSALISRNALTVTRPMTSITSSMARLPFSISSTSGPAVARPSPATRPAPGCWPWTHGARFCTVSSGWLLLPVEHPTETTVGQGVATNLPLRPGHLRRLIRATHLRSKRVAPKSGNRL